MYPSNPDDPESPHGPSIRHCVPATQARPRLAWSIVLVAGFLFAAATVPRTALAQCEREWAKGSGLPGVDGTVDAMVVFNDGSGDALYVGGSFKIAGDTFVQNIAKWDGTKWSAVGSGTVGSVYALAVFNDGSGPALYAGGYFRTAGGVAANKIAKWDGTAWSALGTGIGPPYDPNQYQPDHVAALATFDDGNGLALYAGGQFTMAGGVVANNVAKWDGSEWSALGAGIEPGFDAGLMGWVSTWVSALTVFDNGAGPALYVGGYFRKAGDGVDAYNIAKWDGGNWSNVGKQGELGTTYALASFDAGDGPALYAGAQGIGAFGYIAKWNGSSWSHVGSGGGAALAVFDDGTGPALYTAGGFPTSTPRAVLGVKKWNGASWSLLGTGMEGQAFASVGALAVFNDGSGPALYTGGYFETAGNVGADGIAKWGGTHWSSLGTGTSAGVNAFAVFDDGGGPALYAGGRFLSIGDASASRIAKWNSITGKWSALGAGIGNYQSSPGFVLALTGFDDGSGPALYAAGGFTSAGGLGANYIAKWDGATWSSLGTGTNSVINALAVFDDGSGPALYAGGYFTTAGGVHVNRVGKWNGATWSALGSGIDSQFGSISNGSIVFALTVFDDGSGPALYVGGGFTDAGGVAAHSFAKWNGTHWYALGTDTNTVYAFTTFDDGGGPALYASGSFLSLGIGRIAKWNSAARSWSAVGNSTATVPTVFNDGGGPALYAAVGNHVAQWDGTTWSALGPGMNGSISALAGLDDGTGPALFAGGSFTTVGDKVSAHLAKWSCVVGSCCDTNGADQGCTDNVNEPICTGPDKVWMNQGTCADQECHCVPNCNGATCGDDGCGGSCGTCDDDGNPCNGAETCGPSRTCVAGTPLNCNDGNACNGVETCDPASGCVPGTLDERQPFRLDILPGACPNVLNIHGRYSVPVAIVATPRVAVSEIDIDSLTLRRADGLGEPIQPDLGFRHNNVEILDVATPTDGSACACNPCGPDGLDDLLIEFPSGQLTRKLDLDRLPSGTSVELLLTGSLLDDTPFELTDCVLTAGNPRGRADSKHQEK